MLNRRQFGTYLGLTLLGLATGGLAMQQEKPLSEPLYKGFPTSHKQPPHYLMNVWAREGMVLKMRADGSGWDAVEVRG